MLSDLKSLLRDQLGLPSWAVLAAAGIVAHFVVNALLRKPMTSGWGLLGPLVVGIAIESWEIWVHYRNIGLFAPGNDPLLVILGRHGLDVLVMLAVPLGIVIIGALAAR